jgi:hypothetical protein
MVWLYELITALEPSSSSMLATKLRAIISSQPSSIRLFRRSSILASVGYQHAFSKLELELTLLDIELGDAVGNQFEEAVVGEGIVGDVHADVVRDDQVQVLLAWRGGRAEKE